MKVNQISHNEFNINKSRFENASNVSAVNFYGIKQPLTAIAVEDFKTESAKKLFARIHKYCQLAKNGGDMKDIKILSEELKFYNRKTMEKFTTTVDTLMSIRSDSDKALLKLYRMYPSKDKHCILEAQLDEHGQMVRGFYQYGHLQFERNKDNVRRIRSDERTLLPHGDNDREWGLTIEILPILHQDSDNSSRGTFEIFIELARLYTTLYK